MTGSRLSREAAAVLPWITAAFLWFGLVSPMRGDQENRLNEQSRIRRDRLKSERALREAHSLRARIGGALGSVCRASSDPAALRQRAVAATAGLSLSPFTLSVVGGPDGGATVDAFGSRDSALELLKRLGDPARGGFLRTTTIRDKGARWSISATTGVFELFRGGLIPAPSGCPSVSDSPKAEAVPGAAKSEAPQGRLPVRRSTPYARPSEVAPVMPEPTPAPPFTLVAFLISEGKSRVSIRVRDEVRVISVGEMVDGWRCVSIDRDEGVGFTSPLNGRVVLKAGPIER